LYIKIINFKMNAKLSQELYSEIEVTLETAIGLGLNEEEFQKILEIMGRTPTYTELGMYSVLWSEHCSYKNSIKLLKTLPRSGKNLLVDAGEENAGLVDIGGGYGIVFKIESHNHPSAIEPFQGAATGVGGILRDIFTMGARPIAALNSLRFGELDNDRTKFLLKGVVSGIGHYGNCFGVPTIGGDIYFDDCYQDNPLVNAMAIGIVDIKKTATATASGVGNSVILIGSATGRDGIHGASLLASREFDEHTDEMRPTVQVGDPFTEKVLLEATLELIESGIVVAIQDMGAAGISCSTSEMSAKNGIGMSIDLDKVPLREQEMSAYEIMLSESQERMLAVIQKGKENICYDICKKWGINSVQIGKITNDGLIHLWRNGKYVAEINAASLVLGGGAPQNDREYQEPKYIKEIKEKSTTDCNSLLQKYADLPATEKIFIKLLSSPTIASKRWIYEQYDSQVRTNTMSIRGDAGILRLKELQGKGIAVCTDSNSRYCYLNPYRGAMAAVCEAARNVACVGARPVAITNCLNFGNPYDKEVYWQFKEAIKGMGDACRYLDLPVTGGNVSFHNESKNKAIFPTPTIGMLGVIDDVNKVMSSNYKNKGDLIYMLGTNRNEIGGSEYLKIIHNQITGDAPYISVEEEKKLIETLLELTDKQIINAAHDIAEGGLVITLAEMAIQSKHLGNYIKLKDKSAGTFFGESQSRVVVTIKPENEINLLNICKENEVNIEKIGSVIENRFIIESVIKLDVTKIADIYENTIQKILLN
jgi:phosphoribosylformylglycinamidine synthase